MFKQLTIGLLFAKVLKTKSMKFRKCIDQDQIRYAVIIRLAAASYVTSSNCLPLEIGAI